jgi:hypothetical protein
MVLPPAEKPPELDEEDVRRMVREKIAEYADYPDLFVLFVFPWGVPNSPLAKEYPRDWQLQELRELGEAVRACPENAWEAIQKAIGSGHGIGKSALVSWIIHWAMSTFVDTKGVITANTETQLRTKTWAELAKWHRLAINADWFEYTATAYISSDPKHRKTWRIDMIPWSETNTEAFAGLHNLGKRIILIFDEASAIPDIIWEVSEGALTDENTQIIWCVYGNPTRNTGRFKDCFSSLRHRWTNKQIDSRNVKGTNKKQLQKWVDDYGEDSDFVRVRVRGVFPRAGDNQFIASDKADAAMARKCEVLPGTPKLLAVDVARFGGDKTVFARRHGRKVEPLKKYQGLDTMSVADLIVKEHIENRPDVIFIDGTGIGAGVVDRCVQLGIAVIEVIAGGKPSADLEDIVYNKRAEMWYRMREWLDTADIPDDRELNDDLVNIKYSYDAKFKIQMERKEDMKKRGVASPDNADAIALTFAEKTAPVRGNFDDMRPPELEDF